MKNRRLNWIRSSIGDRRTIERSLRLTTGLILFAYATSHFINHAFGVRSVEAMQAASAVLLAPWQTLVGRFVLYGSFFIHGLLGLYALYRRRHLRIPFAEAWQLGLGFAIPILLIPHAGVIRLGISFYGLQFDYERILYNLWIGSPGVALPRQILLLFVVWIHGCIGIRAWLRTKPWYPRATAPLASLATLIPSLALLGFISAGLELREVTQRNLLQKATAASEAAGATSASASLDQMIDYLLIFYVAVVAAILIFRILRGWYTKRFHSVKITYPGPRIFSVPAGFSILEASRWLGIPHASVCGGRGRCSTCRVRVIEGAQLLAAPSLLEKRTLQRIDAPAGVRLACQVRPSADISVEPLVRTTASAASLGARFDAAVDGGRELEIAALFIDLRESTRIASGKMPYDVLYLFDRYVQVVTTAVQRNAGHVTSIAGDGVMSVFGLHGGAHQAARAAFDAALDIWTGLDSLNEELAGELDGPLRFGIGLHVGPAVVGWIATSGSQSLQFLGDTGNIAAKLEAHTKQIDCTMVASRQALNLARPGLIPHEASTASIPGKSEPIAMVVFRSKDELQQSLSAGSKP
jgi:adenylate cyclase